MKNNVMKLPKICEVCGKEYLPTSNRQRYCTLCGSEAKHRNHIARCKAYYDSTYIHKGHNQRGANNNRYRAGTGSGRQYTAYRKNVCEVCGCDGTDTRLVVHHRDGNCTNNVPGNLITLCDSCHKLVHSGKIILEKV